MSEHLSSMKEDYLTEYYIPKNQRTLFANGWAWIIACLLVIGVIGAAFFAIRWATAPAKGKLQAREQINSGAFRIVAYNHFFDLCASIQGNEQVLAATLSELKTAPAADQERLRTNATGVRATLANSIASYNADAAKGYTVGQFRSSSLPFQIPPYTEGAVTSCGS